MLMGVVFEGVVLDGRGFNCLPFRNVLIGLIVSFFQVY